MLGNKKARRAAGLLGAASGSPQAPSTLEGSTLTPGPMVEEIATRWM
jgi:hypothetical protein